MVETGKPMEYSEFLAGKTIAATIHRALVLWSNPGDTVLSPFLGIGSEGVEAMKLNRRFVGVELKLEYF